MSNETLAAAAEIMGVPEPLVQRSAQARAQVGGIGVDEILGAWSGGAAVTPSAAPPPAAPPPEPEPVPKSAPAAQAVEPVPAPTPPAEAATAVAVLGNTHPGRLTGIDRAPGKPWLPSWPEWSACSWSPCSLRWSCRLFDGIPQTPPPSGLSELGLQGRDVYVTEGCWYCHTQQVRPIVTDAKLGPVTRADLLASFAPDTLGIQRIGPDLAHAGSREPTNDPAWLTKFLTNPRR